MTVFQAIVTALIEGLTEFLPVSSSAHLLLLERLLAWPAQRPEFAVAVQIGALFAVLFSFRREVVSLVLAWLRPASTENAPVLRRLGMALVLATVPVLVVAYLAFEAIATALSDVRVIAGSTLFFGWVMLIADRAVRPVKGLNDLSVANGLLIGVVQIFALIPGASRTGINIMIGRMLGFGSDAAARFSYLLSIPVIGAAASLGLYRTLTVGDAVDWQGFGLTVAVTAVTAWAGIRAFLALLQWIGLLPFIIYRMLLGILLLIVLG
jgi:undecaprenyl-diphosphatase